MILIFLIHILTAGSGPDGRGPSWIERNIIADYPADWPDDDACEFLLTRPE